MKGKTIIRKPRSKVDVVKKTLATRKKVESSKLDKDAFNNLMRRLTILGFSEAPVTRTVDLQKKGVKPNFKNRRTAMTADQTVFYLDFEKIRLELSSTYNKTLNDGKGAYAQKYGAVFVRIIHKNSDKLQKKPVYHLKFNRINSPRGMNDRVIEIAKLLIHVCRLLDLSVKNIKNTEPQYNFLQHNSALAFESAGMYQSFDKNKVELFAKTILHLENQKMIDLYVSIVRNRFYYWREEKPDGTFKPVRHSEKKRKKYTKNTRHVAFLRSKKK